MLAVFKITANGDDITGVMADRVAEITVTDKPGMESDECSIKVDDRDGLVAIPPRGAMVQIRLGWQGQSLFDFGVYVIDEVSITGGPRSMMIKGKPANLRGAVKSHRNQGYENTTLAAIVQIIAERHGWEAACQVSATIPRVDQLGESDIHFITRMARLYNATATVKEGKLLVLPRQGGASASGLSLPSITLTPSDVFPGWEITFTDRSGVATVKTKSHDPKTGLEAVHIATSSEAASGINGVHTDHHTHPDPSTAQAAATAKLAALNRQTARATLSMIGRGDISAESLLVLQGFKPGADGQYLVDTVSQTYANGGWTTAIELNAGNEGKTKAGMTQSKPSSNSAGATGTAAPKTTTLVIPDAKGVVY